MQTLRCAKTLLTAGHLVCAQHAQVEAAEALDVGRHVVMSAGWV